MSANRGSRRFLTHGSWEFTRLSRGGGAMGRHGETFNRPPKCQIIRAKLRATLRIPPQSAIFNPKSAETADGSRTERTERSEIACAEHSPQGCMRRHAANRPRREPEGVRAAASINRGGCWADEPIPLIRPNQGKMKMESSRIALRGAGGTRRQDADGDGLEARATSFHSRVRSVIGRNLGFLRPNQAKMEMESSHVLPPHRGGLQRQGPAATLGTPTEGADGTHGDWRVGESLPARKSDLIKPE